MQLLFPVNAIYSHKVPLPLVIAGSPWLSMVIKNRKIEKEKERESEKEREKERKKEGAKRRKRVRLKKRKGEL